MKYKIAVNDQKFEVEIKDISEGIAHVNVNGQPFDVLIENYGDITTGSTTTVPVMPPVAAPAAAKTPAPSPKPAPAPPKAAAPVTDRMATPAPATTPKRCMLRVKS